MKTILSILFALGTVLHADVPSTLNYQGRVLQNGQPFDGTGHFVFGIYEGPTLLWTNKLPVPSPLNDPAAAIDTSDAKALTVRDGVFTVRLGEGDANNAPVGSDVFFKFDAVQRVRSDVKLKVWFSPLAEGPYTRLDPDITFSSVPYAQVAGVAETVSATSGVPVGAVVAWWGTSTTLPPGFEICSGGPPLTPGAMITSKPDLRGRFPRGAEGARTNVVSSPFTGGADTISTRISGDVGLTTSQIPNHFHRVQLDTRTNVTTPPRTGSHTHSIEGPYSSDEGGNGRVSGMTDDQNFGNIIFPIFANTSGSAHQHRVDGFTGTNDSFNNLPGSADGGGGTVGQAHNHTIPSHDNRPAYLELFYIIRVK